MRRISLALLSLLAYGCGEDAGTDAGPMMSADAGGGDAGSGADAGTDAAADEDAGFDGGEGDAGGNDAGAAISIPACGTAADDWGFGVSDVGTPDAARPVGVVSMSPGYLEATLDAENGDAFYVFCTPTDWTGDFNVNLFAISAGDVEYVHVHDGDAMVFGPEVAPSTSTATSGTWALLPDHLYVLEVHGSRGAFF